MFTRLSNSPGQAMHVLASRLTQSINCDQEQVSFLSNVTARMKRGVFKKCHLRLIINFKADPFFKFIENVQFSTLVEYLTSSLVLIPMNERITSLDNLTLLLQILQIYNVLTYLFN